MGAVGWVVVPWVGVGRGRAHAGRGSCCPLGRRAAGVAGEGNAESEGGRGHRGCSGLAEGGRSGRSVVLRPAPNPPPPVAPTHPPRPYSCTRAPIYPPHPYTTHLLRRVALVQLVVQIQRHLLRFDSHTRQTTQGKRMNSTPRLAAGLVGVAGISGCWVWVWVVGRGVGARAPGSAPSAGTGGTRGGAAPRRTWGGSEECSAAGASRMRPGDAGRRDAEMNDGKESKTTQRCCSRQLDTAVPPPCLLISRICASLLSASLSCGLSSYSYKHSQRVSAYRSALSAGAHCQNVSRVSSLSSSTPLSGLAEVTDQTARDRYGYTDTVHG